MIIFNKIKRNIFISNLFFVIINILINFILYLLNVRFRLEIIIFIILISIIGFIIGVIQLFLTKRKIIVTSLFGVVQITILIFLFLAVTNFTFSYKPEHITTLDSKKYVAVVSSFQYVDVDYYDYYGFLLMGTKVKVHGDFKEGNYDPFDNPNNPDGVEYTYYDDNGKIELKRVEVYVKNKDGEIIDKNIYDIDINKTNKFDDSDNYLLPENEEVLYEKKFSQTILRFGKVNDVLGQNMLVNVLRSKDDGKNFYVVSKDIIQVSNKAKFEFLNEELGFIINTGKIYLNDQKTGLYRTDDSGKTFTSSKFKYINKNIDYINIESLPYYEKNILKIKCSVYQFNDKNNNYENKELIFISNDNGATWNLED